MHISKFVTPENSTEKKEKQYLDLSSVELNIGTGTVLAVEPIICNSPADIAKSCAGAAEKKAAITLTPLRVLAILAGAYIAMGGILNTVITNDLGNYFGDGLTRLIGGMVFSLGLILVILGGAELFTGNNLVMTTGLLDKKITIKQVVNNWVNVYIFNFVGAVLVASLVYYSGIWKFNDGAVGLKALSVASGKVNLSFSEALVRGILCNWLVCLAVWLSMAGKDAFGKILGIMIPVTAFVAMGLEHSIANMYFVPMGIFLSGQEALIANISPAVLEGLTWFGFLKNLVPVTIGNMIGGIFFVATAYWNVYLKPHTREKKSWHALYG